MRTHSMRLAIKGTCICFLIGSLISCGKRTADDKPEPIVGGKSVNVKYIENGPPQWQHGGILHVDIKTGDSWTIVSVGGGGQSKETALNVGGESANDKTPLFGYAVIDEGFADKHTFVRQQGGTLIVQTYTIFKDTSGRTNFGSVETFKKAH